MNNIQNHQINIGLHFLPDNEEVRQTQTDSPIYLLQSYVIFDWISLFIEVFVELMNSASERKS